MGYPASRLLHLVLVVLSAEPSLATCPEGFQGPPDCLTDIDECATNNGDCVAPRGTCVNTMGAHYCYNSANAIAYPETEAATMHWRIAVVLVNGWEAFPANYTDRYWNSATTYRLRYYTKEEVGTGVFTSPDGIKAFFKEASYGRASISGVVVEWQDDFGRTSSELEANRDTYFLNAYASIDPLQYDVFMLVGLASSGVNAKGILMQNRVPAEGGGWLYGKGIVFLTNSAFFTEAGRTRFDGWILPSVPWSHELLHTLGLMGHSNSFWCYPSADSYNDENANTLTDLAAATSPLSSACAQKAYGDPFSLMGERLWASHPSAVSKMELGWIVDQEVVRIDLSSGSPLASPVSVDLYSHSRRTNGAQGGSKALVIEILVPPFDVTLLGTGASPDPTATLNRVTVEFREAAGFDRYLAALGSDPLGFHASWYLDMNYAWNSTLGQGVYSVENFIDVEGALIYVDNVDSSDSQTVRLIDCNANVTAGIKDYPSPKGWRGNAGKFADAMLGQGRSFTTPLLPIKISVTGVTSDVNGTKALQVYVENDMVTSTTSTTSTPDAQTPDAQTSDVQAKGDPHLINVLGQHFDVRVPGVHTFLQIPLNAHAAAALLTVRADVRRLGAACSDMYVQGVSLNGKWVGNETIVYKVGQMPEKQDWVRFHEVMVKVVPAHTKTNVPYLNLLVKGLQKVKYPVGGLLGEADHEWVSTPEAHCLKRVSLDSRQSKYSLRKG